MTAIFDQGFSVSATIQELNVYDWNAADLQWVIANKKGKLRAWAKSELAEIKKYEAVLDEGAEFDS